MSTLRPKYLILTDLDGTLLNSEGNLSQETIEYVHYLNTREDILFLFNTGRQWHECKEIYEKLQLKGFASCCNSAFIFNPHTSQSVCYCLPRKVIRSILESDLIAKHLDSGTMVSEKFPVIFKPKIMQEALRQIEDADLDVHCVKFFFEETCPNIEEKLSYIKSLFPNLKITIFKYPKLINVELQASHITKEFAVEYLSNYYGISPKNILTFGDNHNDISVLMGSSRSYAVANAIPQIKQYAKYISKYTNDQNAVINEVKQFCNNLNI